MLLLLQGQTCSFRIALTTGEVNSDHSQRIWKLAKTWCPARVHSDAPPVIPFLIADITNTAPLIGIYQIEDHSVPH